MNQRKAGAILSYLSMFLGYGISILYTPIMLRILGQSEYGTYNLVASIVSYLGLLNLGLSGSYVRFYSRYKVKNEKENIAKLNGIFLYVFSLLGIVTIIAGVYLVHNLDFILGIKLTVKELNISKKLMIIMVLNMALLLPTNIFTSYITVKEQFIFMKTLQLLKMIANPMIILPILLLGYGSVGMVMVTTLINISVMIVNIVYCFRKLKIKFMFRNLNFKLMKEIFVFSSFIFFHMIMDQLLWNVDKFILGRFRGTTAVAMYGVAAQLNMYYLSLATAISNVFDPKINKIVASSNDNKILTELLIRVGRLQFIVVSVVLMGLIFFGHPFIIKWAGQNYSDSYLITLMLIIPVTLPLIQNLTITIQRAKNMQKIPSLITFIVGILNLIISIPLAKKYGGLGSATGTAIALIIGNLFILNLYYHYKMGLNMKQFWKEIFKIFPALIPNFIFGIIIVKFVDLYNIYNFLVFGGFFVIIYFVSMWCIGMNESEKILINEPMSLLMKKLRR